MTKEALEAKVEAVMNRFIDVWNADIAALRESVLDTEAIPTDEVPSLQEVGERERTFDQEEVRGWLRELLQMQDSKDASLRDGTGRLGMGIAQTWDFFDDADMLQIDRDEYLKSAKEEANAYGLILDIINEHQVTLYLKE